ncbi:hypothetical protein ACJBU6_04175 [Exserohilum turcicum]
MENACPLRGEAMSQKASARAGIYRHSFDIRLLGFAKIRPPGYSLLGRQTQPVQGNWGDTNADRGTRRTGTLSLAFAVSFSPNMKKSWSPRLSVSKGTVSTWRCVSDVRAYSAPYPVPPSLPRSAPVEIRWTSSSPF